LILILVEVIQTVHQQLSSGEPRVTAHLVRSFIGIGILSASRHAVAIGAELSFSADQNSHPSQDTLLVELGLNVAAILVLVVGFQIAGREARNREPRQP
jgi:hypothetical protein